MVRAHPQSLGAPCGHRPCCPDTVLGSLQPPSQASPRGGPRPWTLHLAMPRAARCPAHCTRLPAARPCWQEAFALRMNRTRSLRKPQAHENVGLQGWGVGHMRSVRFRLSTRSGRCTHVCQKNHFTGLWFARRTLPPSLPRSLLPSLPLVLGGLLLCCDPCSSAGTDRGGCVPAPSPAPEASLSVAPPITSEARRLSWPPCGAACLRLSREHCSAGV